MPGFGATSFVVSTSALQVLTPADPARQFVILQNVGTTTAYLGGSNLGASGSGSSFGFPVASNGAVTLDGLVANEPLYAVAGGSVPLRILSRN